MDLIIAPICFFSLRRDAIIIDIIVFDNFFKNNNKDKTKIFSNNFVAENKDKCKIIYQNKEYELKEYFEDIDDNYKNKEEISFILRINKNITNMSHMFFYCEELLLIRDISNINNFYNNRFYQFKYLFKKIKKLFSISKLIYN